MKINSNLQILIAILIIVAVVTLGYMSIYAHNPFSQMLALIKSFGQSMENKQAPELIGIEHWINGDPFTLESVREKKVVLIDFWTYGCINCQRSTPYVVEWDKKYRDSGLVVIGVHTPEFRFESKLENVQQAVADYGIEYPVALDNGYKTWRAFNNRYWPAKYLIDKDGQIVYMRFGEGAYDITEQKIKELLAELNQN